MTGPDSGADGPVVVLIGAPGAGKTRIGKRIARLLDVPFVDTDRRIVAEHGPIPEIFARHGEAYFRSLERQQVARALGEHAVVALGGGAVLDPATRSELEWHRVAQLSVSAEAVANRISGDKRPLVNGVEAWSALVEARRPVYDHLANRTFDTSSRPIEKIAVDIVDWIQRQKK